MKFHCNVEIHDRTLSVCSQRRSQSILAFAKKSADDAEVCLYLQTRQKKQGTKYQIANNIEQVFTKFIADGKITIRLTRPCHDLIIQSDTIQLKSFLHILKRIKNERIQNYDNIVKDFTLMPDVYFNSSDFSLGKVKVVVKKKSEYPTLQGFPKTTEHLILSGLDRRSFDRQILRLQSLRILDLSNNKISSLPKEIGTLPHLQQLLLSGNNFGNSPRSKWAWLEQSAIKHNLTYLDISNNSLAELPKQIKNLAALIHLKINQNKLTNLPHNIKALRNLKVLDVAKNCLSYLPGAIRHLQLQSLDIAENPFVKYPNLINGHMNNENTTSVKMQSLVELSAKIILKSRLTYDESTIPYTLVEFLDEAKCCHVCRSACFDCFIKKFLFLHLGNVVVKTSVCATYQFECYFCSLFCANRYSV